MSSLYANSNQYSWIALSLATQGDASELIVSRKIKTLVLVNSILILESLSHNKRNQDSDTQFILVLITITVICWRTRKGQEFDLGVLYPPHCLIIIYSSFIPGQSLGQENPLEKETVTQLQDPCLENSMDRGARWATYSSWSHKELDVTEQLTHGDVDGRHHINKSIFETESILPTL